MNQHIGTGELFLAGGGDADDSRPIDERLVKEAGRDATMGYIPVALPSERYPDCEKWIKSVFNQYGLTDIEMWTSLTEVDVEAITEVSAIYIGGGNTYRLLKKLRTSGVDRLLREFVSEGGLLYGGSAGAIICGETIETTPDENHFGMTDTSALEFLPNVDVWCHYGSSDAVRQHAMTTDQAILALPERSGVSITATHFEVVGHEPVYVFRDKDMNTYSPNEQFQLRQ